MELNEKNLFARYYNWIYDSFPNDVCTFFWGTLLAILISPILIPGRLCKSWEDGFGGILGKGLACWFAFAVCVVFGLPVLTLIHGKDWVMTLPFIPGILYLAIAGALLIGTVVAFISGIVYLVLAYQKYKRNQPYVYIEPKPTV